MRLLKVIMRPDKVDQVREAIDLALAPGMTVTDVRGQGAQKGHTTHYRGQAHQLPMLPRVELEVVVAEQGREAATASIIAAARTGEVGDGRIYVLPVERSYRIRAGEQDLF